VKEYRVYDVRTDSLVATIPHPGITATVYGLSPNTRYGYYVKAVDNANNVSAASLVAYAKTDRVVVRLKGTDRYATAVMTSQEAYPTGTETVIVATGTNWPDALGGSALAGALDAPILLTRQGALPSEVVSEIRRLKATKAIVLGGASAVSASVEATLKNMLGQGNVERIAGANRYETADRIAAKTIALLGDAFDGTAFVATGVNFPDALGASPLAAAGGWPIYLANPNQGANAGLAAVMRSAGIKRTVVLGGTNVVASSVETSLRGLGSVTRLAGANRYDTAVKTAAWGVANAGLSWDKVAVATGQTFPDALAGGVLQGASDSVMLLTPAKALAQGPAAALAANEATIMEVRYLGAAPAAVW
jgi:putative cell wall-binding protein